MTARETTLTKVWKSLHASRVLFPSSCGFPQAFVRGLGDTDLGDLSCELVVGLVFGGYGFLDAAPPGVRCATWQYAPGITSNDRVSYLPLRYSQLIPTFSRYGSYPVDALVVHLTPPDREGFCSLGVSPSYLAPLAESVPRLIGVINPQMPVTDGHRKVHLDQLESYVEIDAPLEQFARASWSQTDAAVARNVASLVDDGATLQIGLGAIPEALPQYLAKNSDLGLFGMMTDGAMDLMTSGIVTGARYSPFPRCVEVGEVVGTQPLFDFVNANSGVRVVASDYAMHPDTFEAIPSLVAINSALEVDLSGQVNAETIGHRILSGAGGQCDYMQGAQLSSGGRSVIALPSTTRDGRSRIVFSLSRGSVVTTPRTAVSHVVTEHGIAELKGRSLDDRIAAMVAIAAPEHRDTLTRSLSKGDDLD